MNLKETRSGGHPNPIIAFVWRPEEITEAVVRLAQRTGSRAIFDLSRMDLPDARLALKAAAAQEESVNLKVSPAALMESSLEAFLEETAIKGLWVEFHSILFQGDPHRFLARLGELAPHCECLPIFSEVELVMEVLDKYPGLRNIVLKGCEASGLVSPETIFTLYATVRDRMRERREPPHLFIWGGLATPEAAAAFLATGARGLVFESLHWLTDQVGINDQKRQGILKLRPDHTELVGLNLNVPCRLFNKGNSLAVKELRELAASLGDGAPTREQGLALVQRVESAALHPLKSRFHREELIPLGVEAAFAGAFAARFGAASEDAINGFMAEIGRLCALAEQHPRPFQDSPMAREMGTTYPFIQGAMSWITDVPEFALAVAEAGGLPTLALGLMDGETLDRKLGKLPEIMGDRPYAVNIVALAENPFRDSQLAWIKEHRPRFAVIAAGEPSYAGDLRKKGIEVIYIAPNEEMLRLALAADIRYVILEGNEAGGHVGQHTTLTLAQIMLDLKRREPSLCRDRRLILAGGIYNRETAFMAALLGADAIQMGTAYLAVREIVATGALTEVYQRQIVNASPGMTVVSGETTGLRVRSLKTPRVEALCALERDLARTKADEAGSRRKIEELTAGSLFLAARGLDRPGGAKVEEQVCLEQGQFMSGACAGAINRVQTLAELHGELAAGGFEEARPAGEARQEKPTEARGPRPGRPSADREPRWERLAITGMSVVNALGNTPEEIWAASVALKSGIVAVPPEKWDHQAFYHPRPRTQDKTYCKVGAFQHIDISRKDLGIPPQDFRTMTQATRLTLWLAAQAIHQAGILNSDIPRERIGVLISQNSGEAAHTLSDIIIRGSLDRILASVKRVVDLNLELEEAILKDMKSGLLAVDDTTLLGRLNCTAGGFISRKYGFMGPSYSVSAACATSLVALYSAIQMIRNGIIDAAVVGGGEEDLTPLHFLEFSALGALAGISGRECPPWESSRPFDSTRDGMVLGEGGAMIIIERESTARRRGAKAQAYITGLGASNNHLGLVESSRETQEIAIRAAFEDVPYGPEEVDLVECHATATFQGDVEEVNALKSFFAGDRRTILTSFKSQIGHTLGASGLNSLIRGVMAMQAGIFPPTLNYRHPDQEMGIEGSGLWVPTEPLDWKVVDGRPRRLQVNSFGFGGSNYVMQLEESLDSRDQVLISSPEGVQPDRKTGPGSELPSGILVARTEIAGHPYRLAALVDSPEELRDRLQGMEPVGDGLPAKTLRVLARQGVHLGAATEAPPPLALVFPGQGAQYAGMGYELYQTFPVMREWMDRAAAIADFPLLQMLFHDREENLLKTRWQQPATYTLEFAMVQYLLSLGVRPVAMAGHSLGELVALGVAGVYSFEDGFRLANKRAQCMDKAGAMHADPGIMMAVDAPLELLDEMLRGQETVYITNINAPNQVVLGGDTQVVKALGDDLKSRGYRATVLRVSMAFHSPIMRVIREEMQEFIDSLPFHPPQIPVVSNTTREPFPADPVEIKKIVMAHLESPVHWMENVRTLWDQFGIRLFTEVGPGGALSNLIAESLEAPDCLQTCLPEAETLTFKTALAQLFARGQLPVPTPRFISLFPSQQVPQVSVPGPARLAVPLPSQGDPVARIMQREINAFIVESFGRFLIPGLLNAIRREHDPNFKEEDLERLLRSYFPNPGPATLRDQVPASTPLPVIAASMPWGTPAAEPSPQAPSPELGSLDFTEEIIRIIMEATGYERDEIEPDMDLRLDLGIRSSRLPVIMDTAESRFGVQIRLEDFLEVRTVADLGQRIAQVVTAQKGQGPAPAVTAGAAVSAAPEKPPLSREEKALKRMVFEDLPLETGKAAPLGLQPGETVIILAPAEKSALSEELGAIFQQEYGVTPLPVTFLEETSGPETLGFDLRSPEGARRALKRLGEVPSLAGLVVVLDEELDRRLTGVEEVADLICGLFSPLKSLAASPQKKFALLIHQGEDRYDLKRVLAEGLLGMFLSAAQEYVSVKFRTVRADGLTDLKEVVGQALDRSLPVVETVYHQGELLTGAGRVTPGAFRDLPGLQLSSGDVVVFSGGGYGITTSLARCLAPFNPRIVLLGRTRIDLEPEIENTLKEGEPSEKSLRWQLMERSPEIPQEALDLEVARLLKARTVLKTLEDLRALGLEVAYFSCDVAEARQVDATLGEIIRRYGKIDGIIHGAGILRDGFLAQMTPQDVQAVTAVKFLGAWHLFNAAQKAGLRFMVGLSSGVAIQGNPGQTNYAAANRMMSALFSHLSRQHPDIVFKALMLPAVAETGMAAAPEIRHLLEKMNVGYIQPEELAELFLRELFLSPPEEVWVLFMRTLPEVKSVRLDFSEPPPAPGEIRAGTVAFSSDNFPLVDAVSLLDLHKGEIRATRAFSRERDLWIEDHKPFKFLKHPLVSTIMALEAFMETSRLLFPYLRVRGVREARFLEIVACPPGVVREAEITCRRMEAATGEVVCELSMETPEISPAGRVLDCSSVNYRAQVILGADAAVLEELPGFPLQPGELDTRPLDHQEVLEWYRKRSDMQDRYRVMEDLDGTGPQVIRGRTIYRAGKDFTTPPAPDFQYSPYLLEALLQLAAFYVVMRDEEEPRSLIPVRIGEMTFSRKCRDQERITVEARMTAEDQEGLTWDAMALDEEGRAIMQVRDLRLNWFSD